MNALSGTGVEAAAALVELPLPPPPPPPEEPVPVDVERVVPLAEVVCPDDVPVLVLVFVNTVELVPAVESFESCELEFTVVVADALVVLPDKAEVVELADETPLVGVDVNKDLLDAADPEPAPEDEPAVLEAVAGTVPAVLACT